MAYDEALANRIGVILKDQPNVVGKKMFGGIAFMVSGNMCCGVLSDVLVARISPEDGEDALEEPHVRPMDFTGRPMRGWLYVGPAVELDDEALEGWVQRCLDHCLTLKPK